MSTCKQLPRQTGNAAPCGSACPTIRPLTCGLSYCQSESSFSLILLLAASRSLSTLAFNSGSLANALLTTPTQRSFGVDPFGLNSGIAFQQQLRSCQGAPQASQLVACLLLLPRFSSDQGGHQLNPINLSHLLSELAA